MNTDVIKMTDLELAKVQGQVYQQLMQAQQNLQIISREIEKRTLKEVKEEKKK